MLPPDIGAIAPMTPQSQNGLEIMSMPLREAREAFERQYLEAQITRFGGNISRTAAFVGMERWHKGHHLRRRPGRLQHRALPCQRG